MKPAPPADRATLLRRLSLDLTGLPPAPAELEEFLADPSEAAYQKQVDRLLSSPRHGERWGRHWLDVVRFSESHGFEYDKIRENAWPYRDYVIRSLNADKPYLEFVKEQIAGDVLEPPTVDGLIATGFLVAGPWDEAGNLQQSVVMRARTREEELEDIVSAVSQTFLAMTVNCARCHDHKFDPIPQRDYYRLQSAIAGVRRGDRQLLTPGEARIREAELARLEGSARHLADRIARIDRAAARRVLESRAKESARRVPAPLARFVFGEDGPEASGATLAGGATISGGRLHLDGKGGYLKSAPLERAVREKTLEAWVSIANLGQRGGGVISLEQDDGSVFDALVFAEREEKRWMAGSNFYLRSRDLRAPAEEAGPGETIHLAAVYRSSGEIAVYRNGQPYGQSYVPAGAGAEVPTYPSGRARILIGLRHTGAGDGFFQGEVEEARLHDRALSAAEIEQSFRSSPAAVSAGEAASSLSAAEREERAAAAAGLESAREALRRLRTVPVVYTVNGAEPPPTFVLSRGDVEKKAEPVSAGGLSAVACPPADFGLPGDAPEGMRRLKLAEWLASPENPLTARAIVNRVWHYHFGRGIAASPSDFGVNGERPTHPELLDWLASEFLEHGSSLKGLHRAIVLSSAYRQSSLFDARWAGRDGESSLLWRYPPRRLEAEAARDSMLFVSGELNGKMGGPGFRPFTVRIFNSFLYTPTDPEGPEYARRSVYRHGVTSLKDPLLDALDCPDPSVKTPRRAITTTPLQSVELMNSTFVLRQSRAFARRIEREAGEEWKKRLDLAYRLAYGRRPSEAERERAEAFARKEGLESFAWTLFNSSEFLYLR
jgi:hypothetical protein